MLRPNLTFTRVLLLLIIFSTLAVSCLPPLNDFRYADNATLLEEAIKQLESGPTTGSTRIIGGTSPVKQWPVDSNGIVNIKYCFRNEEAKNKLQPALRSGWLLWYNLLGNAGPGKGHRLGGISETVSGGQSVYCWISWDMQIWNPKVPSGTLQIELRDYSQGGEATLGYRPVEWDPRFDRHTLRLGYDSKNPVQYNAYVAAHELGHVFGFIHEHRRPDRDHYVHFECKNLANYDRAVVLAKSHPTLTIEQLCVSPLYSRLSPWNELPFVPFDYSTIPFYELLHWDKDGKPDGTNHRYTMTYDRVYDMMSIMHYPSISNARKAQKYTDLPLLRWKKGGPGYAPPKEATDQNSEIIRFGMEPTRTDVEALKMVYPWNG